MYPSGAAVTTASMAILVPVPGRFFDDEWLAQSLRQPMTRLTSNDALRAAGGIADNQSRGIGPRSHRERPCRCRVDQHGELAPPHSALPPDSRYRALTPSEKQTAPEYLTLVAGTHNAEDAKFGSGVTEGW